MGKKRRILRRAKFAALRKHTKFEALVEANLAWEEEPKELVELVVPETPPVFVEPETTPPVLLVEKLEPKPKATETSVKVEAKKTSSIKKPRTGRSSRKKTATQSTR